MKKSILYALLLTINYQLVTAQDTVALRFSKNITAAHLSQYLHVLASDEFEGRETGQKGQKLAAAYIASHFKNIGIPELRSGGYFQQYSVQKESWDGYEVLLSATTGKSLIAYKGIKPEKEMISFNNTCPTSKGDYQHLLFLGYGIK